MTVLKSEINGRIYPLYQVLSFKKYGVKDKTEIQKDINIPMYIAVNINEKLFAIVLKRDYDNSVKLNTKITIEYKEEENKVENTDIFEFVYSEESASRELRDNTYAMYVDCLEAVRNTQTKEEALQYLKDNDMYPEQKEIELEITMKYKTTVFSDEDLTLNQAIENQIYELKHYREDLYYALQESDIINVDLLDKKE